MNKLHHLHFYLHIHYKLKYYKSVLGTTLLVIEEGLMTL